MKSFAIIFFFVIGSHSLWAAPPKQYSQQELQMYFAEVQKQYEDEKKSPLLAASLSCLPFSIFILGGGHYYLGNTKKGVLLTVGGLASIALVPLFALTTTSGIAMAGMIAYLGLWLYSWISAFEDANAYNARLRRKLFEKHYYKPSAKGSHKAELAYSFRF